MKTVRILTVNYIVTLMSYSCKTILLITLFLSVIVRACSPEPAIEQKKQVRTGAKVLIDNYLEELSGKRVGLVMNPTARVNGTHMLDTLLNRNVDITALFSPEHGFRGDRGAGETIKDGIDQTTGLPVYSLYGETKKPTADMMEKVDILLFDIQDVGARFYTYNATLGNVLEAAAAYDTEVWVLDRPNPAGGYVGGWVLGKEFTSFVGAYPIPVAHGLTLGELGSMMIGEGWLDIKEKPVYRVIEMEGWNHNMLWPENNMEWIPPSPNLPEFENALVYLGTAFFEGTTISEGRGTMAPFLTIGDPHFRYDRTAMEKLEKKYHVAIDSITFTPRSIPGKSLNPKHEGKKCYGIQISVPDFGRFTRPVAFGIDLVRTMLTLTPGAETNTFLYKLAGNKEQITKLLKEKSLNPEQTWQTQIEAFRKKRQKYLRYN